MTFKDLANQCEVTGPRKIRKVRGIATVEASGVLTY